MCLGSALSAARRPLQLDVMTNSGGAMMFEARKIVSVLVLVFSVIRRAILTP